MSPPCRLGALVLASALVASAAHVQAQPRDPCAAPLPELARWNQLAQALAGDEAKWNARSDLDRWLNPASYASPVRPDRYKAGATDFEAITWMLEAPRRQRLPGAPALARVLLLPQLEAVYSTATQACNMARGDLLVSGQLGELARAGLDLTIQAYQAPPRAEFVKRVQASRRKVFTIVRAAQAGEVQALETLQRLTDEARRDDFSARASDLFDDVERVRATASAAGNTVATAALGWQVHTWEQAHEAIVAAGSAQTLRMLQGIAAAAPLVIELLAESRKQSDREAAKFDACGSESADMSVADRGRVFECRRRWDHAHPE